MPTTNYRGYLSPDAVARMARELPQGIVRFIEGGEVAVYRADVLGWMVTGHERAWGSPRELVETFGPWEPI